MKVIRTTIHTGIPSPLTKVDPFFSGPVPKFFSNDPSKTLEELHKSPQFAFECLQALVARLLERGELNRYKS